MKATPYGPNPWVQQHWDWRAAGNFIGGGLGSGLIVAAVAGQASGWLLAVALLLGAASIGAGLLCVWAEIGRPLRALNVFFNPRTSWMTREGLVGVVLMPCVALAALGWPAWAWPAAALALAFVYCQGRILRAARGIPAWREPAIVAMIVTTALAEGTAAWLLLLAAHGVAHGASMLLAAAAWLARGLAWLWYASRLHAHATPAVTRALALAGRTLLWAGTVAPLTLLALVQAGLMPGATGLAIVALAAVPAAAAGAWFKFTLITRAAFNQGFALRHLPVRGARR